MCDITFLDYLINQLDQINKNILYSIHEQDLESDRIHCIENINKQCQKFKSKPDLNQQDQFIKLIKKYIEIQDYYKKQKRNQIEFQLLVKNPNLSQSEINHLINYDSCQSILSIFDKHNQAIDCYHDVK